MPLKKVVEGNGNTNMFYGNVRMDEARITEYGIVNFRITDCVKDRCENGLIVKDYDLGQPGRLVD